MEWYHVCWPRLTAKRVEPVVSISWASCSLLLTCKTGAKYFWNKCLCDALAPSASSRYWPFSVFTAKSQPIWIKFCTHLLLYGIHLWADSLASPCMPWGYYVIKVWTVSSNKQYTGQSSSPNSYTTPLVRGGVLPLQQTTGSASSPFSIALARRSRGFTVTTSRHCSPRWGCWQNPFPQSKIMGGATVLKVGGQKFLTPHFLASRDKILLR